MLTNSGSAVINGLEGYRFIGGKNIFDNGTEYPEAKCFCSEKCSPSGIRNVTLCRGAPLFISFPHFYLADPIYVNSIEGLKPNKTEHEFYLIIDQVGTQKLSLNESKVVGKVNLQSRPF